MPYDAIPRFKNKAAKPVGARRESLDVVVIGSGPVGLTLALDLARKGHAVTVLTAFDFIPHGSKAICFAKQSLDIFDRLGVGDRVREKGVSWNVGKLFWQDRKEPIYEFDLLPLKGQRNPAFVNIQQYYVEDYLIDALEALDHVDIRWGHAVQDVAIAGGRARLSVVADGDDYEIDAGFALACDGHRSPTREALGLDFSGRIFEDNFLIADIRFRGRDADGRPSERWFWFDPPFCKGGTALLHKQPDDVWRCDFQLGWDVDRDAAVRPENVEPFIRGMFGADVDFEPVWYSVYTFQCRRMDRFVHGPVVFLGDSAHLVSPFGARGANGGLADADNLAWKVDLVLRGEAPRSLLNTYDEERIVAADDNIANSSRATDFMTPKGVGPQALRDGVLELAGAYPEARPYINSGRLSAPTPYRQSSLSTPDRDEWTGGPPPGHPCPDAPLGEDWLLSRLGGAFRVVSFGGAAAAAPCETVEISDQSDVAARYGAGDGGVYLVRPDQVVAARWKEPTPAEIDQALIRARGGSP
ncbi:MAG: FAD-dependent oxidoreductase [Pseudomonadota bacterium]